MANGSNCSWTVCRSTPPAVPNRCGPGSSSRIACGRTCCSAGPPCSSSTTSTAGQASGSVLTSRSACLSSACLQHVVRYCARPAFALERLTVTGGRDGKPEHVRSTLPRHKRGQWIGPGRNKKATAPDAQGIRARRRAGGTATHITRQRTAHRVDGAERVNDFETAAERMECRGVVQVCGLLADFRVG